MVDKFYSAELSEYHIGFRYEKLVFNDDTLEEEWQQFVFPEKGLCTTDENGDPDLVELFYSNLKTDCRVKYLDQQDIEELGWIYDVNEGGEEIPNLFDEHGYSEGYLIESGVNGYFLYHFPDSFLCIYHYFDSAGQGYLFKGQIKNYSELQTLMKQIGI